MITKFESTIREIKYPQQSVYDMLSDLNNIERVKDRLPEDKINDLTFDSDSIHVNSGLGEVTLRIVQRDEPKTIKFETDKSPLPFNFWVQLLPIDDDRCKMKLTIKADINPFLKAMVKGPLQQGIEKIADALQAIHYEEEEE